MAGNTTAPCYESAIFPPVESPMLSDYDLLFFTCLRLGCYVRSFARSTGVVDEHKEDQKNRLTNVSVNGFSGETAWIFCQILSL